jgi:heme a synthase
MHHMTSMTHRAGTSSSAFVRAAWVTVVLTYLLMAAGAFVRVSGAGMGCPDWPRCFGLWIPPTSVDDLPPLHTYSYPPGWRVETFDPLMTWIEFTNRLLGALVGVAILVTVVLAVRSYRHQRSVWLPSVIGLVGVLYAGWLGSRVVAHELAPWIVTVHLLSAWLVLAALLFALQAALTPVVWHASTPASKLAGAALLLTLLQSVVGTQVRGLLEDVAKAQPQLMRGQWLERVGAVDVGHRTFALLCALLVVMMLLSVRAQRLTSATRPALVAVAAVVAQCVLGVVLSYADLPRAAQVLHLLVATILMGALWWTWLRARVHAPRA